MDCDAANRLIDRVYETGLSGNGWNGLLESAADLMRADRAWMVFANPALEHFEVVSPRSDPVTISDYQRYWWRHDLTRNVTAHAKAGQITTLADTGRERFLSSRFHNEFWRHSGQAAERIAVNLLIEGTTRVVLGIQPKQHDEDLGRELIHQVNALIPHFSRAARIHYEMRRLEIERLMTRVATTNQFLIVDAKARVAFVEDDALALLRATPVLQLKGNRIAFIAGQQQNEFLRLLASCGRSNVNTVRGGALVARDDAGNAVARFDVMPFSMTGEPAYSELSLLPDSPCLVAITDLNRARRDACRVVREFYDLTPAEANVAIELMRGDTRSEVARRVGVKLSTIRSHMMHIFSKVGVNSRHELVGALVKAGVDRQVF